MITINKMINTLNGSAEMELKGLSTEEKPTNINGFAVGVNSIFLEQDTGDFYYLKQQGSESQGDFVYEETIKEDFWFLSNDNYYYNGIGNITASTIKVIWNGVSYICKSRPYGSDGDIEFGAPIVNGQYDFSEYPFGIYTYRDEMGLNFVAPTNAEANVEIYEYSYVDAVWAKIGGGGDSPTPSGELLYEGTLELEDAGGYYSAQLPYDKKLPNEITVVWNGVTYDCTKHGNDDEYGAEWLGTGYDWSEYPFCIYYSLGIYIVESNEGGSIEIKIYGEILPAEYETILENTSFTADDLIDTGIYRYNAKSLDWTGDPTTSTIKVIFDGDEYIMPANSSFGLYEYGACFSGDVDFTTYPVGINFEYDHGVRNFYVADTNEHTITVMKEV